MATLKRPMYCPDDLRGPTYGKDVQIAKFGIHRYRDNLLPRPPTGYTYSFGLAMQEAVEKIQRAEGIHPASGNIGQATWDVIWKELDLYRRAQYRAWEPPPPPAPPLVEPYQGWGSLRAELWELYSIGIRMGLRDGPGLASGTYNASSTLPSGRPSDHAAGPPANAFDLDIGPDTGFMNETARDFFYICVHHPRCGYVILGNRIWSASRASEGVRSYTGGGHMNHVHVSGH